MSLLTTHYPPLTTYYLLLTTHYSLLTTHYLLLTTYFLLLTGGLSLDDVERQLDDADANYVKWRFDDELPKGGELMEALFADHPIEWNRLGVFQMVWFLVSSE